MDSAAEITQLKAEGKLTISPYLGMSDVEIAQAWDRRMDVSPAEFYRLNTHALPQPAILHDFTIDACTGDMGVTVRTQAPYASMAWSYHREECMVALADVEVEASHQGMGIAKKLMANLLNTAEAIGAQSMDLYANEKGGYAWAKFGFKPMESWVDNLRVELRYRLRQYRTELNKTAEGREVFANVEKLLSLPVAEMVWPISDIVYKVKPNEETAALLKLSEQEMAPLGKCLLMGCRWFGELELSPDAPGYRRLTGYLQLGRDTQVDKALRAESEISHAP